MASVGQARLQDQAGVSLEHGAGDWADGARVLATVGVTAASSCPGTAPTLTVRGLEEWENSGFACEETTWQLARTWATAP